MTQVHNSLPGVSLGQTSAKADGGDMGSLLGEEVGETHIGWHLWRLEGLPWLWTGSKSSDRFNVAQAIFLPDFQRWLSRYHKGDQLRWQNALNNRFLSNLFLEMSELW